MVDVRDIENSRFKPPPLSSFPDSSTSAGLSPLQDPVMDDVSPSLPVPVSCSASPARIPVSPGVSSSSVTSPHVCHLLRLCSSVRAVPDSPSRRRCFQHLAKILRVIAHTLPSRSLARLGGISFQQSLETTDHVLPGSPGSRAHLDAHTRLELVRTSKCVRKHVSFSSSGFGDPS